jgi:hypothetical protein
MSGRPKGTKKGVQQDDSRRRREEKSISLRKDKKEEGLSKRRILEQNVFVMTHGGGIPCIYIRDPDTNIIYCVKLLRDFAPYNFTSYEASTCSDTRFRKLDIFNFLQSSMHKKDSMQINEAYEILVEYNIAISSYMDYYKDEWLSLHKGVITIFIKGDRIPQKLYGPNPSKHSMTETEECNIEITIRATGVTYFFDENVDTNGNIICVTKTVTRAISDLFSVVIFVIPEVREKCIHLFTSFVGSETITIVKNTNFLGDPVFNTYVYLFLYNEKINIETRQGNLTNYKAFMAERLIPIETVLKYITNLIINMDSSGNISLNICKTIPYVIYQSMVISYVGECNIYDSTCDHNEFTYRLTNENTDKVWCSINTNEETKDLPFEHKLTLFANTIDPFNLGVIKKRLT